MPSIDERISTLTEELKVAVEKHNQALEVVNTEKEKHTIPITNIYDPNVDYYIERDKYYGNKNKITTNKDKIKI